MKTRSLTAKEFADFARIVAMTVKNQYKASPLLFVGNWLFSAALWAGIVYYFSN